MKMRTRYSTLCMSLVMALATLWGSPDDSHAKTRDSKVLPGSICISNNSDVVPMPDGRLYNTAKRMQRQVFCPLVREGAEANDWWTQVSIRYINGHPSSKVSCTMEERDRWGKIRKRQKAISTTRPHGTIKFSNYRSAGTGSFFMVTCLLPPARPGYAGGGIELISLTEFD